ncbi:MAG: hypothetical protein MUC56_09835 [Thermoanaerobaculales bacterium]|jgi:hypothetical protein|nr:hypothetical protein [Thermoanaerobaculales bacterium]
MTMITERRAGRARRLMCLLMVLGAAAAAVAGESASPLVVALEARVAAGDLEYRDPQTGQVVLATAERVAALRNELAPQFEPPAVLARTVAADGTIGFVSDGTPRDVMLVRVNLDGTREHACVRDLDSAVAFVVGLEAAPEPGPVARPVETE